MYDGDVVVFTIEGNPSSEMCDALFIAPVDSLIARGVPFSLILNGAGISNVSITASLRIIKWMHRNRKQIKKYLRATAVLLQGRSVKAAINFVFSVQPPVAPMQFVDSMSAGWDFVSQHQS